MKRRMFTLILAALLTVQTIAMAGCAARNDDTEKQNANAGNVSTEDTTFAPTEVETVLPPTGEVDYPDAAEKASKNYGVTFTAKNVTATGATLTFYQEDVQLSGELSSPEWYAIEVYVMDSEWEGHWEKLMPQDRPDIAMTSAEYYGCAAYEVCEQYATQFTVDWSDMYGELPPGGYRIVKILRENAADGTVNDTYYYARFNISEKAFAGYGLTLSDLPEAARPISDPLTEEDLMLVTVEATSRRISAVSKTLDGQREIAVGYGKSYFLERFDGSEWSAVPVLPPYLFSFTMEAYVGVYKRTEDFTNIYGDLDPGVYRLVKSWGAQYYAYFEITE